VVEEPDYIDAEIVPTPGPFAEGVIRAANVYTDAVLGGVARSVNELFKP